MLHLIINQTTDKTFSFTLKKKHFVLEPGTKNIIDSDICPAELSKFRATGELFITPITASTLEFYKTLAVKVSVEKEVAVEDTKLLRKTKVNDKDL